MILAAAVATALSLLAPAPARTLVAAGDIASCRSSGDERTAALVARTPGTVAALGDIVYERGIGGRVPRLLLVAPLPRPHTRGARQPRVRLGGRTARQGVLRAAGSRLLLLRPRRLARRRPQLELRPGRRLPGRVAAAALARRRPRAQLGPLHARLLAPPALQLRPARLRRDDGRALAHARPRPGRRRAGRPRPPLRALRPDRRDPLVRRRHRRAQPLPGAVAGAAERGRERHDVRRAAAEPAGRLRTTGASCRSQGRASATAALAPAADAKRLPRAPCWRAREPECPRRSVSRRSRCWPGSRAGRGAVPSGWPRSGSRRRACDTRWTGGT